MVPWTRSRRPECSIDHVQVSMLIGKYAENPNSIKKRYCEECTSLVSVDTEYMSLDP